MLQVYEMIQEQDHVYLEWLSHLEMLAEEQYRYRTVLHRTVLYCTVQLYCAVLYCIVSLYCRITKTCDYAFSRENFFHEHVALAFPADSPWVSRWDTDQLIEIEKTIYSMFNIQYFISITHIC